MAKFHIPQTYEEWRDCITEVCGQLLTAPYIETRIAVLNKPIDHMMARFVSLCGEPQRIKTLAWL